MTRLERTTELFVRRLYEAAFIDQSMLLNTRFHIWLSDIKTTEASVKSLDHVTVYLCSTMWHETYDEMMTFISSLFRLDRYRPKHRSQKDRLSLEGHIYFDDAFIEETNEQSGKKTLYANTHVALLVRVIEEVFR
ncbi:chitin synthase chs-1-like [Acipenser oxyrinchus oxyrinchus]|uniref:Chitin synthase chs-1-like n=1 Tax=Acipenser oxyrinchus oxyrinchus TaxID=40147 RepID=A0AAD8GC75_ACIOX|nr:chitin synthase chs-1-like [Acipenser oxyrinchus oxyrinchus]